jgi:hypothetical protein
VEIPNRLAPMLLTSVRDAMTFTEGLMSSETVTDHEEHLVPPSSLLEFLKEEDQEIENEVGMPLEKLL